MAILILAALLVRALAAPFLPSVFPDGSDPNSYRLLAEGQEAFGMRAFFPPLYPMLLSVVPIWLLNPAIDLGIAASIIALGHALNRDAFWPAAIYLFWPQVILTTLTPQKDTLAILLACQVVLAALNLRAGKRAEIHMGVAGALLALTQPAFVPFSPVLFLALCWRQWRKGFIVVATMLLVMLPWWIRNWLVFDAFVPLTTSTGYNLYVAADGFYDDLPKFMAMGEIEGSKAAAKAAIEIWKDHSLTVIFHRVAAPAKAILFDRAFYDLTYWLPDYQRLRSIIFWPALVYWWGILVLFAVGIRQAPRLLWIILAACCIELAVFNFWFEFGERHRYLIVPFMLLAISNPITERSGEFRAQQP